MIKVKFTFNQDGRTIWSYPLTTSKFQSLLSHHGVHSVQCGHDIEFIEAELIKNIDCPTIVFDRSDTCIVSELPMRFHDHPNVLGFVIPTKNDDFELANTYRKWNVRPATKPVELVTLLAWYSNREVFRQEVTTIKRYHASFVGSLSYPLVPYCERHRRRLASQWHVIEGQSVGAFTAIKRHSPIPHPLSWEILQESYAVVAPWGVTELCWRDYQACLGRCMIIKPYQGKIEAYSNPWRPENTVWCKPDFSDLKEAVDLARERWNFDNLDQIRTELLNDMADLPALSVKVAAAIKNIAYVSDQ